jgi:MipA family protein
LGITGIVSPNVYKDSKTSYLILPFIAYKGDRLSIYGPKVNYKIAGKYFYGISLDASLYSSKFKPSDSSDPSLQKLNERNYSVLAGVNGFLALDRTNKFSLGAYRSFFSADNGYVFKGAYTASFMFNFKKSMIRLSPSIGLQYDSAKLINYYYGISNQEHSKSGLPEYQPNFAITPYVSLSAMYIIEKKWTIGLNAKISMLSSSIKNSPMVDKSYGLSGVVFASYSF